MVVIDPDDDARDGVLFRLWIRLAAECPGDVARELAYCVTLQSYREALMRLAQKHRANLP